MVPFVAAPERSEIHTSGLCVAITIEPQVIVTLSHNIASSVVMQTDVNLAASRNTGWVYMTNDNLPNPYDTLPSYWNQLVTAVDG